MSTTQPTYDEILRLFKETDESFKETAERFKETDKKFKETDEKFKEIAERFKETDKKFKETDKKFKETDEIFKETNERFKLSEGQLQEGRQELKEIRRIFWEMSDATDRKIKEVSASIGKLGNRLGDFIEDAVRPAAVRLFQGRGIAVHEVQQNVTLQRGEEGLEIDLMVVNDSEAVAVECKSNLKIDDVNEHLDRLAKLKRLLPRYAGFKVMGAVAAMVIPDNVARYAASKGLFVIGQIGEDLVIRNDEDFMPKVW